MKELKELELKKRQELLEIFDDLDYSNGDAKQLLIYLEDENFLEITAPKADEVPLEYTRINATHMGQYSGRSYKPGNIIFNIKKAVPKSINILFDTTVSIGAIASAQPIIAIFKILSKMITAIDFCRVELNGDAAFVLAVLWENKASYTNHGLDTEAAFETINNKLTEMNRPILSKMIYNDILEFLHKIGTITIDNGNIILKEKVSISY